MSQETVRPIDTICHSLVKLASLPAQERWMLEATQEEYVLPDELLNGAFHVVASVRGDYPWVAEVEQPEREAIMTFGTVLDEEAVKIDEFSTEWEYLVHRSKAWATIRTAARECLGKLGFDIESWEQQEVQGRPSQS